MSKVVDISENTPHRVSEVICVHCGWRWISVRPTETLLKALECPDCTNQGYVIETGQPLKDE
jgi:predicted nucleic-acid-binding Zn-ribbon protein